MKIILINGPPRSGKDFAGRAIAAAIPGPTRIVKMAKELKERCHAAHRLINVHGEPFAHDTFEDNKDKPTAVFEGMTPREAYIAFSENWIKPTFGAAQLGRWLADDIDEFPCATHIVTDSGFTEEAMVLVQEFGAENITLLRVHRKGYDFSGDSRGYIDLPVRTLDLINDEAFKETLFDFFT